MVNKDKDKNGTLSMVRVSNVQLKKFEDKNKTLLKVRRLVARFAIVNEK